MERRIGKETKEHIGFRADSLYSPVLSMLKLLCLGFLTFRIKTITPGSQSYYKDLNDPVHTENLAYH